MMRNQANGEVDSVPDHKDQDHAHPYLLSRDKIACSGTNVSDPAAPWKSVIFKEPVSELHTKLCIEIQDTPPKPHDETQDMPPMHDPDHPPPAAETPKPAERLGPHTRSMTTWEQEQDAHLVEVETVNEEEEPYYMPMGDPPLIEQPNAMPVDPKDVDFPNHLKERQPGEPNPNDEPLKFINEQLTTPNPDC
jgi:hypothetical protein